MANVIDRFLVALGFDVDQQSEKKVGQSIDGVRKNALAMGAALSAAFVGADRAVKSTAGQMDSLTKSARLLSGVGSSDLRAFQFAFERVGGSAADAEATLSQLERLIHSVRTGQAGGIAESVQMAGVNPQFLLDAQTSVGLLDAIARRMEGLDERGQNRLADALGLGPGANLLLREGADAISEYMRRAKELNPILDEQYFAIERLTDSRRDLEEAWSGFWQRFAAEAAPGITETTERMTELIVRAQQLADIAGRAFGDNYQAASALGAAGAATVALGGAGLAAKGLGMTTAATALTTASTVPMLAASGVVGYQAGKHVAAPVVDRLINRATGYESLGDFVFGATQGEGMRINRIDRIEINVDGSRDPSSVADEVIDRLNTEIDRANQSLDTGLRG